jgi:hypothetical protein
MRHWWAGKQSAVKNKANKGMLRTGISRAFLGMAAPFYAQKGTLHASRKCGRYVVKMIRIRANTYED